MHEKYKVTQSGGTIFTDIRDAFACPEVPRHICDMLVLGILIKLAWLEFNTQRGEKGPISKNDVHM